MVISAVYPGTFDPVTNGHLDLLGRSLSVFGRVVVAVAKNPGKTPLFSVEERVELIQEALTGIGNVEVVAFESLLVEFCRKNGLNVVIRGLRAVSDFEYELQISQMNRKLDNGIETVFMTPGEEYTFLSSRLIKEIAGFGRDVSGLAPAHVAEALAKKMGRKNG